MRSVTLRDVSRAAGVSPSTASRALAGDRRISAATRRRVAEAAEALAYAPNAAARSLARRRSFALGLVFPQAAPVDLANPFFPEVLRGIVTAASPRGYHLLLLDGGPHHRSKARRGGSAECLELLRSRRVDGVLLLGSHVNQTLVADLLQEGFPFVLLGRLAEPAPSPVAAVDNDNVELAWRATRHLIEHGHRRIGLVTGPEDMVVSLDRLEGYRRALEAGGLPFEPDLVVHTDFSAEQGYRATQRLLETSAAPTALLMVDDHLAMGAYRAIEEAGLTVGGDVSVVGVNDTPAARLARPPLSVMRIPIFDMGVEAGSMLIDLVEGRARPRQVVVPAEFVERGSCGPAPSGSVTAAGGVRARGKEGRHGAVGAPGAAGCAG